MFFSVLPSSLAAQTSEVDRSPLVTTIALKVALDPTTFAPATLAYVGQRMDWASSQSLFRMGYVEANPRFTISSRANDRPVNEAEGYRRIRRQALRQLAVSAAHNLVVNVATELAVRRYPEHRRLIRTLSWMERIGVGAVVSYVALAPHLEQARTNRRLAARGKYNHPYTQ